MNVLTTVLFYYYYYTLHTTTYIRAVQVCVHTHAASAPREAPREYFQQPATAESQHILQRPDSKVAGFYKGLLFLVFTQ